MTTGCGILLLVDEDVIVEAKWIRSNSEIAIPPKRVQSPAKNYQISSLPLFNYLSSQENAV